MRIDGYDSAVDAALTVAREAGLYVILRIQDAVERRLVVVDGGVERQRVTRMLGLGVHAFGPDGAIGFSSIDDVTPDGAREAVRRAGRMVDAARRVDAERSTAPFGLRGAGRVRSGPGDGAKSISLTGTLPILADAQSDLSDLDVGAARTIRTALTATDEEWRVVRSDGTDLGFVTSRAAVRHEASGRLDGKIVRAVANVSGADVGPLLGPSGLERLARRLRRSASDVVAASLASPPRAGSYRLVLDYALAKGLAHEAIGHLCESDVDGSVLMRAGRLRVGERVARETVSIVDGPLPGDYAQQPYSANGLERETVRLVDRGVLAGGLGDPFTPAEANISMRSADRVGGFRDRPMPRMSNIRVEVSDAAPLAVDPSLLTPDDAMLALRHVGLLDPQVPTLYLRGYRGGQAHPRRGDFIFAADAAFELTDGGAPRSAASFSGLAERALASIVAGIGPLCTDGMGACQKDGSTVPCSGGSHALLVLDPDPDSIVTAAR